MNDRKPSPLDYEYPSHVPPEKPFSRQTTLAITIFVFALPLALFVFLFHVGQLTRRVL